MLKMDLSEEKNRDQEEMENKKKTKKTLIEIVNEPDRLNAYSDIEKDTLADKYETSTFFY